MMGFGYKFTNTPLSIALDFRPGYAMLLNIGWEALFHSFGFECSLLLLAHSVRLDYGSLRRKSDRAI